MTATWRRAPDASSGWRTDAWWRTSGAAREPLPSPRGARLAREPLRAPPAAALPLLHLPRCGRAGGHPELRREPRAGGARPIPRAGRRRPGAIEPPRLRPGHGGRHRRLPPPRNAGGAGHLVLVHGPAGPHRRDAAGPG